MPGAKNTAQCSLTRMPTGKHQSWALNDTFVDIRSQQPRSDSAFGRQLFDYKSFQPEDFKLKHRTHAGTLERLRGAMAAVENQQLFWLEGYYRVGLSVCISELHQFSHITA